MLFVKGMLFVKSMLFDKKYAVCEKYVVLYGTFDLLAGDRYVFWRRGERKRDVYKMWICHR